MYLTKDHSVYPEEISQLWGKWDFAFLGCMHIESSIYTCMYAYVLVCRCVWMLLRHGARGSHGHPSAASSLLPPCGIQDWSQSYQACYQASSPISHLANLVWNRVSHSTDWPQTHYVVKTWPELLILWLLPPSGDEIGCKPPYWLR